MMKEIDPFLLKSDNTSSLILIITVTYELLHLT